MLSAHILKLLRKDSHSINIIVIYRIFFKSQMWTNGQKLELTTINLLKKNYIIILENYKNTQEEEQQLLVYAQFIHLYQKKSIFKCSQQLCSQQPQTGNNSKVYQLGSRISKLWYIRMWNITQQQKGTDHQNIQQHQ